MPHSKPDDTTCAALPVVGRSLFLTFCETHQAYDLYIMRTVQRGDDVETLERLEVDFGPFYSWYEIERECKAALDLLLQ